MSAHPNNLEVAQSVTPRPIMEVAHELGLAPEHVSPLGRHKAKVQLESLSARPARGRLVLVTAMTPTHSGEGKTTVTVGLAQALRRRGRLALPALRQPSLGPILGMKGGGCGGGRAQVLPMEEINLHFTGDLHAIASAHNLLAALVDNELHYAGPAKLDAGRITWRRAIDMNDRSLRRVMVGHDMAREDGFDITAASEVMAIVSLARDLADLKERLGRILVGWSTTDTPVFARDLHASGAMTALLRDALEPNLVQTMEGGPALVHGGPFANIAHGCSSIVATRLGLCYADDVVTEAGFATDLGAEKFFDIKCRTAGIWPQAVVLVATCRALKHHGGTPLEHMSLPNPGAVQRGLENLQKHVENIREFGFAPIVAVNLFDADTEEELGVVEAFCRDAGLVCSRADAFRGGGAGCAGLADAVLAAYERAPANAQYLYSMNLPPEEKIATIARRMYGAGAVTFEARAREGLDRVRRLGLGALPVCIAKTQTSLSDVAHQIGRPVGFPFTVRDVRVSAGAGFLVAIAGNILTMPGLPRSPAAYDIDVDADGRLRGLF